MEFKGTKAKWRCVIPEGYGNSTLVMCGTDIICDMVKFDGKRYNALLISKSPEMLEMLKKVLEVNEYHNFNGHLINEQIEQLIKEATEL